MRLPRAAGVATHLSLCLPWPSVVAVAVTGTVLSCTATTLVFAAHLDIDLCTLIVLGSQSDPAAVGSPFLGWCEKHEAQTDFGHYHVMAFAKMLHPLVEWVSRLVHSRG